MRTFEFSLPALAFALTAALVAGTAAAAQPRGVCSPPGSWTTPGDFPTTVVRAWGAFFPANGNFYVLGGRLDDNAGDDFTTISGFDPATDTWSTGTATFPDDNVNNMVGGVLDFGGTPYIVVVGGSAAGGTTGTSDVRQYDPVADVLTTLTSDPWPGNTDGATLPGGAAVVDNKLYVFGGFDISIGMVDTIYQFDPDAAPGSRWTQMNATLPVPLGYIPASTSGGLIYMMGGSTWDGTTIDDSAGAVSYDPVANTFTQLTPIPRATAETRAVTEPDGTIWVLGGGRDAPNPSNEVDIYTPATDTWSLGPAFSAPRRSFPADVDPVTGDIWATGGYDVDGTTPLSINEQFTACSVDDTIFVNGFELP